MAVAWKSVFHLGFSKRREFGFLGKQSLSVRVAYEKDIFRPELSCMEVY